MIVLVIIPPLVQGGLVWLFLICFVLLLLYYCAPLTHWVVVEVCAFLGLVMFGI